MQHRTPSMASNEFYTFWFEKNLQGDIISVYNEGGTKIVSYTYDAWGNMTSTTSNYTGTNVYASLNPFRYRGYYYDEETGFYYLNSRYYNPNWGRFLNADAQLNSGILGYNMFTYCVNNPVMYVDPNGTCVHNGVPYGMGPDCPNCLAGITQPEYDKVQPKSPPKAQETVDYEQYYIDRITEGTLDINNDYGKAQNITNVPLSGFTLVLGVVASKATKGAADAISTSLGVAGIGYMITTPIAMTFHIMNPNLANGEKAIMCGYELGVAYVGIGLAALMAAVNPTLGIVVLVSAVYVGVTIGVGQALQTGFENNNWR